MKIVICTNSDIESNITLNLLKAMLKEHNIHIILSKNVSGGAQNLPVIKFTEQDFINHLFFPWIEQSNNISNETDSDTHHKINNNYLTFNQIASYFNIKINNFSNINKKEGLKFLQQLQPDLIIAVRYGQIFKEQIISIPKYGIINLHSGILPFYQGMMTTFRAMLNGDQKIGTTLHYIEDSKIDDGKIIDIAYLEVNKQKSLLWHIINLYGGGCEMLIDTVNKIKYNKPVKSFSQDRSKQTYYGYPPLEEVELFLQKGYKLFDSGEYMELLNKYKKNTAKTSRYL